MIRRIAAIAVAMTVINVGPAVAGDSKQITMKEIQASRTEIVLANLPLNAEEKAAFDPVYAQYRTEIVKLNERLIGLLGTFADEFETASDDRIDTIMREADSIRSGRIESRKNHVQAFEDAIGVRKTFRLYQIENKLDAIISIQLAAAVPLLPAN